MVVQLRAVWDLKIVLLAAPEHGERQAVLPQPLAIKPTLAAAVVALTARELMRQQVPIVTGILLPQTLEVAAVEQAELLGAPLHILAALAAPAIAWCTGTPRKEKSWNKSTRSFKTIWW